MKHARQVLAAGALTCTLCACAIQQPAVPADATAERNRITAHVAATSASLLGHSKADVIAALGPAGVLRFDSGYEIWVYRFVESPRAGAAGPVARSDGQEAPAELVLLFEPAGVVAKTRVRSAPPNAAAER